METIRRGFLQQVRHPPSWSEAQTLAARFRGRDAEHYFTFLTEPGVEPTNNLTEQAIRHVVIDRRVTQGTRGDDGMRWCERAWTVLATCAQQGRRAFQFFHDTSSPISRPNPPLRCCRKIVNGYDADHVWGNQLFEGAEIIAHRSVPERMKHVAEPEEMPEAAARCRQ